MDLCPSAGAKGKCPETGSQQASDVLLSLPTTPSTGVISMHLKVRSFLSVLWAFELKSCCLGSKCSAPIRLSFLILPTLQEFYFSYPTNNILQPSKVFVPNQTGLSLSFSLYFLLLLSIQCSPQTQAMPYKSLFK